MKIIQIFEDVFLASNDVQESRKAICDSCDKNKMGICSSCLCIIRSKVSTKQARCPEGKWYESEL